MALTHHETMICDIFRRMSKKKGRIAKMLKDMERLKKAGNRPATVERAKRDVDEIREAVLMLRKRHEISINVLCSYTRYCLIAGMKEL
jgi:hypothetical protein